ncbi:MAG: hypothetical protein JWN15_3503 [Firmicutes bacterium]|nr:hypothetical protein [Bacillota bacterium]
MSTYLSGGLTLLLLAALLGFSVQVVGIYHTTRAVDAAIVFAEMEMGLQGCVSSRAVALLRDRVKREGLNPDRLTLNYNIGPKQQRAFWGSQVDLVVTYSEPRELLSNLTAKPFNLVVDRHIATISGWVGQQNEDLCP